MKKKRTGRVKSHGQRSARTPTDQTAIAREIVAADGQINRLIYKLYSLAEEEIRIAEEEKRLA